MSGELFLVLPSVFKINLNKRNKMRKLLPKALLAAGMLLLSLSVQAQQGILEGLIREESNKPVAFINLSVKDRAIGTSTDENGKFRLRLPAGRQIIVVSGIGYEQQEQVVEVREGETVYQELLLTPSIYELPTVEIVGTSAQSYQNELSFVASKTATLLKDVPQAISYVSKELIQDQQAYRLADVAKNFSNVNEFSGYNDFVIRGFRSGSGSTRLVNGLRGGFGFWNQPLLPHMERVEVIKGPASALFANTNPGGTINLVTKKPLPIERQSLSFTTGSYNTFRTAADFTGPLNEEKNLLYRLNIAYENAESFRWLQGRENVLIAPSISFLPSENTQINVDAVYSYNNGKLDRGQAIFNGSTDLTSTPIEFSLSQPGDYQKINDFYVTLSLQQKLSDRLSFNSSYLKFLYTEDLDEHRTSNVFIPGEPTVMQLGYIRREQKDYTDSWTNYFTLNLPTGAVDQKIVVGADYYQQLSNSSSWGARGDDYFLVSRRNAEGAVQVDSLPGGGVRNFDLANPVYSIANNPENYNANWFNRAWQTNPPKTYTYGFYVQDQLKFNRLSILLGLRQEFYRNKLEQEGKMEVVKQQKLLPRLGTVYTLNQQVNLYATYTQGFEPQSARMIMNQDLLGGPFQPETSEMVETGAKSTLLSGKLTANVAMYQITKNNVLVNANDPGNPDLLSQRGQERARGAELDVMGKLSSNWSISANYAYNRAIITRDVPGNPNNLEGLIKENAPLHSGGFWTKYMFAQPVLKGLGIGAGLNHVGERNTFERTLQLPKYTLLNAALFYQVQKFRLSAHAFNLTNTTHWVGGYNYGRIYPGTPRNFLLSVGYTF